MLYSRNFLTFKNKLVLSLVQKTSFSKNPGSPILNTLDRVLYVVYGNLFIWANCKAYLTKVEPWNLKITILNYSDIFILLSVDCVWIN